MTIKLVFTDGFKRTFLDEADFLHQMINDISLQRDIADRLRLGHKMVVEKAQLAKVFS